MTVKQYLLGVRNIDMRIDVMDKYPDEQKALVEFKELVTRQIHGLHDNRHVSLLECRYLQSMTWREVTDRLKFYDDYYVRRCLHLASLKEFEEKYPDYEKYYPIK